MEEHCLPQVAHLRQVRLGLRSSLRSEGRYNGVIQSHQEVDPLTVHEPRKQRRVRLRRVISRILELLL